MSAPSTFNLSSVYRALGLRDARVIPSIATGTLTPVISLGQLETFAPEVIEARGIVNIGPFNILGGQWLGLSHFSASEGGTIIEESQNTDLCFYNLAPVKPFAGVSHVPFAAGGRPLISLFEQTGIQVGPFPSGGTLGGSNTPSGSWPNPGISLLGRVWVPPGWFFWSIQTGGNPNARVAWRFREMPEAQGPA